MTDNARSWSQRIRGATAVALLAGLPSLAAFVGPDAVRHLRSPGAPIDKVKAADAFGKLPLRFEANVGQVDGHAKFVARAAGSTVFLAPDEAVLSFASPTKDKDKDKAGSIGGAVVRMRPLGADPLVAPEGVGPVPGVTNYLKGNDPADWHTGVASYESVRYRGVYPGIDEVFHGRQSAVEYDFTVAPGADPSRITLGIDTSGTIAIDAGGDLVIDTPAGQVRQKRPVVYQEIGGARHLVDGGYALTGADRVGFTVGAYDPTLPLVIDPLIASSAFLGGAGDDTGRDVAVDATGATYITGSTYSADFPTTPGALDRLCGTSADSCGNGDAFVAKLNPAGTALVYATYLGGANGDDGSGITLDGASAWLTGTTGSPDFPTTANGLDRVCGSGFAPSGAADATCNGTTDGWVAKLAEDGASLLYSTFLGGKDTDSAARIIRDDQASGRVGGPIVSVVGTTSSSDFPTLGGFDGRCGGGLDLAGVEDGSCDANVNFTDGSTTLGSPVLTSPTAAFNSSDVGRTVLSSNVPSGARIVTRTSATQVVLSGTATATGTGVGFTIAGRNPSRSDAFLTRFQSTTGELTRSTFFGGNQNDTGRDVAFDPAPQFNFAQMVYITGNTDGGTFPTTPGAFQRTCGAGTPGPTCSNRDGFVAKFLELGDLRLEYSTLLGGNSDEDAAGIAVDPEGNAYITGSTGSPNFPTKDAFQNSRGRNSNPYQPDTSGQDAFLTKLVIDGSAIAFSTFLGGGGAEAGVSVAVDAARSAYVYGYTNSTNFPTLDPFQVYNGIGDNDLFLTKFSPSGRDLSYSTYVGSLGTPGQGSPDDPGAVAVSSAGEAYVTGGTSGENGSDFSSLPGSLRAGPQGGRDAFVLKIIPGRPPVITGLAPNGGPDAGGTTFVITGQNLSGATAVQIGGVAALSFTVVSDTQIRAVSPPRPAGIAPGATVPVTVTTPAATSIASFLSQFRYGEGIPTGQCVGGGCPPDSTLLTLKNGKVLASNGMTELSPAVSQLYDPATGMWSTTGVCAGCGGSVYNIRSRAVVLSDGKVLWTGGVDAGRSPVAGSFLYDPTTGTWSPTKDGSGNVTTMTRDRQDHTATLLPNGKVLVAGGAGAAGRTNTSELYDPATGTWTLTGSMSIPRQYHSASLIDPAKGGCGANCGKVLVAFGGAPTGLGTTNTGELFDPATGTWGQVSESPGTGRLGAAAVQLSDGKVLFIGGGDTLGYGSRDLTSTDLFDPANGPNGSWRPSFPLNEGRGFNPAAVLLPNGEVLATGFDLQYGPAPQFSEIRGLDGRWRRGPLLPTGNGAAVALLPSGPVSACSTRCGMVLAIDGTKAQLYAPVPQVTGLAPARGPAGGSVTITGTGLASVTSVKFGATASATITPDPTSPDTRLSAVVPTGVSGTVDVTVTTAGGVSAAVPADRFTVAPAFSTFVPLSPSRILDTRFGNGAPAARVGAGQSVDIQATGRGGVPATGVTAVALNVTAVNPSAGTFITAWPTGETRPDASNVNLDAGTVVPNLTLVKVGAGGKVSLFNAAGTVDLLGDVAGYYLDPAAATPGSSFAAVSPARILDTRTGTGAPAARVGTGQSLDVQVTGQGGVPATGVTAVALNVTAVAPTAASFVTAWPTGEARPTVSNLNLAPGVTRPNLVIVKVGSGGKISLYNDAGTVDLLGDVAGYYLDPAAASPASTFTAVSPARILDTRTGVGAPAARVGAGQSIDVQITGQGGVPAAGVTSVVLNVTAVAPSAASFVTAWPTGEARPLASNLNLIPGVTVANLVVVKVGAGGKASLYSDTGSVDLLADVAGYNRA